MSTSRKKLLAGLVLLTSLSFYLTVCVGCHSAPPRPTESATNQAQRKAKKGGN